MSDDATPAKVRLTDGLGPDLPDSIADELPDDCARNRVRRYVMEMVAAERERCAKPSEAMELAGMRALRNTYRTVSGEYSREQARACWDAMVAAMKA